MKPKPWTDELRSEALALYRSGLSTMDAISGIVGISLTRVRKMLVASGVEILPRGRKRYLNPTAAEVGRDYESGLTLKQVADKHGMSVGAIVNRLNFAGVKRRPDRHRWEPGHKLPVRIGRNNKHWIELPIKEISELYRSGCSTAEIGALHGVSHVTAGRRLREAGVKLRPGGYPCRCTAKDGHNVASNLEKLVDDWLFDHKIPHSLHPYVPWYQGGSWGQQADFLVADTYIEVWGIEGRAKYDAGRQKKCELYRKYGSHLVEIWPRQLAQQDYSPLECLLKYSRKAGE